MQVRTASSPFPAFISHPYRTLTLTLPRARFPVARCKNCAPACAAGHGPHPGASAQRAGDRTG
eukprot:scaffold74906_cov30-Phaeocystis_antarctica.AAC.1